MEIYTSYFGNAKALEKADIVMVGIARWKPKFFSGINLLDVAPLPFMLKGNLTREQYIESYNRYVLDKLDCKRFLDILGKISLGKDVALCCYEKPNDFCHRHLLADYLENKIGLVVEEFGFSKNVSEKPKDMQLSLFQ